MSKMLSWRSPVFPVADVVPGDRAVTEDSLRVVPRHLKAGGGQGGDADVARGTAGSLAVRHKLLVWWKVKCVAQSERSYVNFT